MLNLFQHLRASPKRSNVDKTRQQTIESAFSRVNVRNAPKDTSTTPSLTTATSLTDTSSELAEESPIVEDPQITLKRAHFVTQDSDKPSLNRKPLRSPRRESSRSGACQISGETLVAGRSESQEQLLQQSVQALDEDWDIGAMPGDNLEPYGKNALTTKQTHALHPELLERASTVVENTKKVLGKRRRETFEGGKTKLQASRREKRSTMQPQEPETPQEKGPTQKRARLSENRNKKLESSRPQTQRKAAKKPTKRWLSHGIYAGQIEGFEARLTETQNRRKHSKSKQKQVAQASILPKPMYTGELIIKKGRPFVLPFDIFSPLPPGQPKPDEWKKTQKNVFIGDAANVWKKSKSLEQSKCICTPETGCDEGCFNRFMLYECDEKNCNIGPELCTNRSFAGLKQRCKAGGKYNIGVEVMKTDDRGYGIRANRTFEPNQIIVEYTGEIITQNECDERMNKRYKDAECYYLMDFDQSMILDATRGSIARFVNHSCSPNCTMVKWNVGGTPRMALFAGEDGIMTGEELTYDYNFNPYSLKNVTECRCGADNCRGVLGPKPKEIKEALKPIVGAGKRKFQKIVEGAVEGVVGAAKRRKINLPTSVKDVISKVRSKAQKPKPKPLPKGWVYPEEAQEFKTVNEVDPEIILRGTKRKDVKDGPEKSQSKRRRTSSDRTMMDSNEMPSFSRRRSSKAEAEEGGVEGQRPISRRDSVKKRAMSVKKNLARTIKRSNRSTPGKSIRVVDDE